MQRFLKKYPAIYNLIQNSSGVCHVSEVSGWVIGCLLHQVYASITSKTGIMRFHLLIEAVRLFLSLLREQSDYKTERCEKGFYSVTTPLNGELLLISVRVPKEHGIFPQISAGKNRLSIHFHCASADSNAHIRSNYSGAFELKYTLQVG